MAKNKSILGKLLTVTTAVATIGGVCYVFRDKIKSHPLYEKTKDKLTDAYDSLSYKFPHTDNEDWEEDDFDSVFSNSEKGREYTSITIQSKTDDEETATAEEITDTADQDSSIPIISFDQALNTTSAQQDNVTGYENEGLSDLSEDPDVLTDQDKLDF
ncbi:MAG: hypothetical protein Q4D51_07145 [Eubacteriales bacterium]|nr:hypothetical protein [Eubacteriales bacterium]